MYTPQQAAARMKDIWASGIDNAGCHMLADNVMCCLLASLGYKEMIDMYLKHKKHYEEEVIDG